MFLKGEKEVSEGTKIAREIQIRVHHELLVQLLLDIFVVPRR
jgi:hypothetical protein